MGKPWNNGVSVGNDTSEHSFEVHFTYLGNGSDKALYIQPNWGSASSGPYTLQIYDLKVETGIIATDWFPAPEDISDQIELQLQNARSQITATADAIRQEVEATYARADDLDKAVQRLSTLAEQTESSFTWTVQQLALLQSDMSGSQQELSDQLAELLTYMTFDSKGLTIGKSGNPVSVLVSNDKLSFLVNGGTVAYFSDNKLYVQNGEFLGSLRLGRFAFVPQSNGNLSLTLVS